MAAVDELHEDYFDPIALLAEDAVSRLTSTHTLAVWYCCCVRLWPLTQVFAGHTAVGALRVQLCHQVHGPVTRPHKLLRRRESCFASTHLSALAQLTRSAAAAAPALTAVDAYRPSINTATLQLCP